ncbi:MAG TPA: SurA N-terminal domain-containing protein [Polyangiaceae bacterium]|nr:SurA N-terminal domain-containing protein [Polyangiaceae bacterium]
MRPAAVLALLASAAPAARATVAERVVAVVGEQAILLSDMRQRARPFLLQIEQKIPAGAQQAAAQSEMFRQLLDRMVDERVEQQAAEKAHLTVTSDEIDAGLRNVASQQGLTLEQLVEEAGKTGLSPQEYRDEVRRQILEGKLLQLRVRSRVRVTDDDVKATYERLVRAERSRLGYRLAWVVLRVPPGSSPAARADREDLAERISATARAGVDGRGSKVEFASLARSFSDDTPTRLLGGDLGLHKPGDLAQVIEDQAMKLDVGGVSPPFVYKNEIVVIKVVSRDPSQIPSLEQARDELLQRTYGEQMDKARKQWIQEIRRSTYVDVRL